MRELTIQPLVKRIVQLSRLGNAAPRRAARGLRALVLCGVPLLQATAFAAMPEVGFRAASIEYGDLRLESVDAALDAAGRLRLEFGQLSGPGQAFLGEGLALEGLLESLSTDAGVQRVSGRLRARGLEALVTLENRGEAFLLEIEAQGLSLPALAGWPGLPPESAWVKRGLLDAGIVLKQQPDEPPAIAFRFGVNDLAFDSPEGRFAGESLRFEWRGSWPDLGLQALSFRGAVHSGELLVDDFYRDFADAGLDFSAEARWTGDTLVIPHLSLGDDGALVVEASARLGSGPGGSDWSMEVSRLELDFPAAYRRYLEPVAAAWTLNGLEVTGRLLWSGEWQDGDLVSGDLEVTDLSIVDTRRRRFAMTGLGAHLRPGDHAFVSRLSWRGLLLGRINLGAGQAALDSEPGAIALLDPLVLDVLGGRLELGVLKIVLPGGRADGSGEPDLLLRARMEELDMGQLTAALDWPSFGGTLSGEIPGVSLDDGVLAVDGEILVDVFGGRIALQNLSMERVFGVLPSLAANVSIEDLDLEQLTQTFEFGRIAGRLDGQINDLRMLDWKPVAFDAWLGTPARQGGSHDISRQAVNHLTTIGGGSATTALTSPLMRMFNSFSYRRLGLGCILQNNTCQLRGLSADDTSVLILEGAGVPKITIRAFNRNVDWPQMVSNLQALSGENPVRIGGDPDP